MCSVGHFLFLFTTVYIRRMDNLKARSQINRKIIGKPTQILAILCEDFNMFRRIFMVYLSVTQPVGREPLLVDLTVHSVQHAVTIIITVPCKVVPVLNTLNII